MNPLAFTREFLANCDTYLSRSRKVRSDSFSQRLF